MIRAPMGNLAYWNKRTDFLEPLIKDNIELLKAVSVNPLYNPQFSFNLSDSHLRLIILRYSKGDAIASLSKPFTGLLDAWELSNKLAAELNANLKPGEVWDHRHSLSAPMPTVDSRGHTDPRSWIFELSWLNHYNWCFWLVGLAL